MADAGALGRALIEAGKAISAQAANTPLPKGGVPDPAQALLPKIDLANKKLSAIESHLSSAPHSSAEVDLVSFNAYQDSTSLILDLCCCLH